jgi:2-succinyl-5-enolpyruvyl-6-hydroxy-3-cyclohexene-1-carboxylate synthase
VSSDQATLAATFVDEWVRSGLTDAVVSPGSRSTPLVLALAADGGVRVHVHIDERSAAFFAVGLGLGSRRPAIVVTTSGTAAAEVHAAVVEAHQARVPLLVCTADRPQELHDVGAPQTITQAGLFGSAVRWSAHVEAGGVPSGMWRPVASRAVAEAVGNPAGPGPVHLNMAFRDPLVGAAGEMPAGRAGGRAWHAVMAASPTDIDGADADALRAIASRRRGVIVAGAGAGDPVAVLEMAKQLGWPVLADARSGCRTGDATVVAAFDAILREPAFAADHTPDVVIHLGAPPASKVLATWLAGVGEHIVVDRYGWTDPERVASLVVRADPTAFCYVAAEEIAPAVQGWDGAWESVETAGQEAIDQVLAHHPEPTEPGVARALTSGLPAGTVLLASSSMPIRDVEWYGHPASAVTVMANRGANGIDGVVSTAAGVAATAASPVVGLLGDLAFLHDSNGLLGAESRPGTLVLVVVDNDGGGIFSFLPQATIDRAAFERLFATPHRLDLRRLAAAYGVPVTAADNSLDVLALVEHAGARPGIHVVHVSTRRTENVAVHEELHAAVAVAVSDLSLTGR